jgi:CheY-like chemotaxis protein
MTAEQLAHLFEPFNRLGNEGGGVEGTGIGLAIVKALVEGMGGDVGISSQLDQGSEVRLRLPVVALGAAETSKPHSLAPYTSLAELVALGRHVPQASILYIEDNPVNVMLVEALVATRPALRLVCETTGEAGVARAIELLPALVLVDMRLPDINGLEVLRRLRCNPATLATPCIALSADALPEHIAQALDAGFVAYWTKPLDVGMFLASLDALFATAANRVT